MMGEEAREEINGRVVKGRGRRKEEDRRRGDETRRMAIGEG